MDKEVLAPIDFYDPVDILIPMINIVIFNYFLNHLYHNICQLESKKRNLHSNQSMKKKTK